MVKLALPRSPGPLGLTRLPEPFGLLGLLGPLGPLATLRLLGLTRFVRFIGPLRPLHPLEPLGLTRGPGCLRGS